MQRDLPSTRQGAAQRLLEGLRSAPWRYGFIPLLRRLSATWSDLPAIGRARRPAQEPVRLGQSASLAFAPREIAEAVLPEELAGTHVGGGPRPHSGNNPNLPTIRVFGLGLLGPNGPLPLHYTEAVRERSQNHHDHTLANFLDLFHHRYLGHMYRAWSISQAAAGLDRRDDEHFTRYVASLTGHDALEIRDSALPDHARLSASVHLSSEARHPDGLASTLARYFGVHVQVEEFIMHWIQIESNDHTRLGWARTSSIMGVGAISGEVVPDRQSKFRLVLGPLTLPQYLRFMPQGQDLPRLVEWVRAFVGYEFAWEVELRVRRDKAPPARLEDVEKLGWSTWLGDPSLSPDPSDYTVGLIFEPEHYLANLENAGSSRNDAATRSPSAMAPAPAVH